MVTVAGVPIASSCSSTDKSVTPFSGMGSRSFETFAMASADAATERAGLDSR